MLCLFFLILLLRRTLSSFSYVICKRVFWHIVYHKVLVRTLRHILTMHSVNISCCKLHNKFSLVSCLVFWQALYGISWQTSCSISFTSVFWHVFENYFLTYTLQVLLNLLCDNYSECTLRRAFSISVVIIPWNIYFCHSFDIYSCGILLIRTCRRCHLWWQNQCHGLTLERWYIMTGLLRYTCNVW